MSPNLTDYVTTETVVQAFNGAKDLAQAGAAATVSYYWASALMGCSVPAIFSMILYWAFKRVSQTHRANLEKKNENGWDFDYIDSGSSRELLFVALIVSIIVWLFALCRFAPAVISPEGALLYDIVTGVSK